MGAVMTSGGRRAREARSAFGALYGFASIDDLARTMGVKGTFHGHHHDSLDYRAEWNSLGFRAYGLCFCGITDLEGGMVRPGDFDDDLACRKGRVKRS